MDKLKWIKENMNENNKILIRTDFGKGWFIHLCMFLSMMMIGQEVQYTKIIQRIWKKNWIKLLIL